MAIKSRIDLGLGRVSMESIGANGSRIYLTLLNNEIMAYVTKYNKRG